VSVDDEEDDTAVIMEQVSAVGDEHVGVHFSGEGREVHRPFGGDRGDHGDRVAGAGGRHDRCLSDRRPRGAGVVVEADASLIGEVHGGADLHGFISDSRVLLSTPTLHPLGILLSGPVQRALR
jgi:hypothetical protein